MQAGTTEDQGLYNKPSAAVHPGALAAGTLPTTIQYNSEICRYRVRSGPRQQNLTKHHDIKSGNTTSEDM